MIRVLLLWVLAAFASLSSFAQISAPSLLQQYLKTETPALLMLYRDLHAAPELSFLEEKTAARLTEELRAAGYEVTTGVGGHGVVGVLKNGEGPVVLLRADMDALPVKEQTGLPYASKATQRSTSGEMVPVMHACGHDMHMAVLIGAARFLAQQTNLFKGTVVCIAQPAEERGGGAKAMLKDGLFEKFPTPNFCLALHVDSTKPGGVVSYVPGFMMANVDSVDITIRGVGGHGAYPHRSKDPIVLAAQTILALQTLISREKEAGDPGVITVGSIHGGTKHNIIPDEVKMQLTVRSYSDTVRTNLLQGIARVTRGIALAAGIPEERMPLVEYDDKEFTPATYNDPALTARWVAALEPWLGKAALLQAKPEMGGEDFGMYGRTQHKVPVCMLRLGSAPREKMPNPPPIHSPFYYPDPEPTLTTGVTTLVAGVLALMKN